MHALAPSRSSLSPLLFDLSTREPPHPRPPSALTSCAVICHATSAGPTVLPVAVSSTSTVVAKRMWCGHCGRVSTRSGRVAGASVAPGVVENSHRGLCYSQTGFLVQRGRSPDTSGGLPRRVHTRLRLLPTSFNFYMPGRYLAHGLACSRFSVMLVAALLQVFGSQLNHPSEAQGLWFMFVLVHDVAV